MASGFLPPLNAAAAIVITTTGVGGGGGMYGSGAPDSMRSGAVSPSNLSTASGGGGGGGGGMTGGMGSGRGGGSSGGGGGATGTGMRTYSPTTAGAARARSTGGGGSFGSSGGGSGSGATSGTPASGTPSSGGGGGPQQVTPGQWLPWVACDKLAGEVQRRGVFAVCTIATSLLASVAEGASGEGGVWVAADGSYTPLIYALDAAFRRAVEAGAVVAYYARVNLQTAVSPAAFATVLHPIPRALVFSTRLLDDRGARMLALVVRREGAVVPPAAALMRAALAPSPAALPRDAVTTDGRGAPLPCGFEPSLLPLPADVAAAWRPAEWVLAFRLSDRELADRRSATWLSLRAAINATLEEVHSSQLPRHVAAQVSHAAAAAVQQAEELRHSSGGGGGGSGGGGIGSGVGGGSGGRGSGGMGSGGSTCVGDDLPALPAPGAALPPTQLPFSISCRHIIEPLPAPGAVGNPQYHAHAAQLVMDPSLEVRLGAAWHAAFHAGADDDLLLHALAASGADAPRAARPELLQRVRAGLAWSLARAACDLKLAVPRVAAPPGGAGGSWEVSLLLPLPLDLPDWHAYPHATTPAPAPQPVVHVAGALYLVATRQPPVPVADATAGGPVPPAVILSYELRQLVPLSSAAVQVLPLLRGRPAWLLAGTYGARPLPPPPPAGAAGGGYGAMPLGAAGSAGSGGGGSGGGRSGMTPPSYGMPYGGPLPTLRGGGRGGGSSSGGAGSGGGMMPGSGSLGSNGSGGGYNSGGVGMGLASPSGGFGGGGQERSFTRDSSGSTTLSPRPPLPVDVPDADAASLADAVARHAAAPSSVPTALPGAAGGVIMDWRSREGGVAVVSVVHATPELAAACRALGVALGSPLPVHVGWLIMAERDTGVGLRVGAPVTFRMSSTRSGMEVVEVAPVAPLGGLGPAAAGATMRTASSGGSDGAAPSPGGGRLLPAQRSGSGGVGTGVPPVTVGARWAYAATGDGGMGGAAVAAGGGSGSSGGYTPSAGMSARSGGGGMGSRTAVSPLGDTGMFGSPLSEPAYVPPPAAPAANSATIFGGLASFGMLGLGGSSAAGGGLGLGGTGTAGGGAGGGGLGGSLVGGLMSADPGGGALPARSGGGTLSLLAGGSRGGAQASFGNETLDSRFLDDLLR